MNRFFKNLLYGFASIFSIFPPHNLYLEKSLYNPNRTDYEALRGDWETVGRDMFSAMDRVSHEPR